MYQLYLYLEYSLVNSGTFHSTFTLTKGVVYFISTPSRVPIPNAMLIYEVQIMSTYTSGIVLLCPHNINNLIPNSEWFLTFHPFPNKPRLILIIVYPPPPSHGETFLHEVYAEAH